MKTILIDPTEMKVRPLELPSGDLTNIIEAIETAESTDVISFTIGVDIWIDDEALMAVSDTTRWFIIKNTSSEPIHLTSGKALVTGVNGNGDTIEIPGWLTVESVSNRIAFVPAEKSEAAASIAEQILELTGPVSTEEELQNVQKQYAVLMALAEELTV